MQSARSVEARRSSEARRARRGMTNTIRARWRDRPALPRLALVRPFRRGVGSGPDDLDVVGGELRIRGHQWKSLGLRLRDEKAVEGVAMMERKIGDAESVMEVERQRLHPCSFGEGGEILLRRLGKLA